jgi:hypothetical protein
LPASRSSSSIPHKINLDEHFDKSTAQNQTRSSQPFKMKSTSRSVMALTANLLALVLVVGVVSNTFGSAEKEKTAAVARVADLPSVVSLLPERELRGKGGKMGKSAPTCIPLDATPAPTKGMGAMSAKGKGSSAAPVSFARLFRV